MDSTEVLPVKDTQYQGYSFGTTTIVVSYYQQMSSRERGEEEDEVILLSVSYPIHGTISMEYKEGEYGDL